MEQTVWCMNGIRLDEWGNLVIDAEPSYGNRKKWEGEMKFNMSPGQLSDFLRQIEEGKSKK